MIAHIPQVVLALALILGRGVQPLTPDPPVEVGARGALPAWFLAAPTPHAVVEPALLRELATGAAEPLHVIVELRPAGTSAASAATRAALVEGLQRDWRRAVAPLETSLAVAQRTGELVARRDLWIVNGLALTAHPALVRRLMAHPGVAEIRWDAFRRYDIPEAPATAPTGPTWGLEQIRAPEVWATLGISGTGAVVGIMDTGVDMHHPALLDTYRGNRGHDLFDHEIAWYDPINESPWPYDDNGHGTHVAGSAVGREHLGVAPDARWIAAKVLASSGGGRDSWIHAGFQWFLAPNGDPALAPDVVNGSWGASLDTLTTFAGDIATLEAAGIFVTFSAGNLGPPPASLSSPASNPGVFAVGASDPDDEVALFSSRGPSPWGEVKPYVVAPGVNVLSAAPGGAYAIADGTSMASPHVAGLAALMRSVSPTLEVGTLARVLTQTAVPLSTTVPNNASGWGRIDAMDALIAVTDVSLVSGTVRSANGRALADATVAAVPHGTGNPGQTKTGPQGRYRLALTAGIYDLTASAFGYAPETRWSVSISPGAPTVVDFALDALPSGSVQGHVTVGGAPPTRTVVVRALNTPRSTTVDAAGAYALLLPAGTYTLEVRGLGYRVVTASVTVPVNGVTLRDFSLSPAPTLLLIDEGAWYYDSQIAYWRQALDALAYPYDLIRIKNPRAQAPMSATLSQYDVVLWSSPSGSPGLVNGAHALDMYLRGGGRLLLSGQNVAYYDGGGDYIVGAQPYVYHTLSIAFVQERVAVPPLTGEGPFAGLDVRLEGGDGADNQTTPDAVGIFDIDRAEAVWRYPDRAIGGVGTHICVPYRAIFLGFGYEGIADRATRHTVMARSIDWLTASPLTRGLSLRSLSTPVVVGQPGERVTHTAYVQHNGIAGAPDTITVTLQGDRWPATLIPEVATLAPCTGLTLTVAVTLPEQMPVDARDRITLTVASRLLSHALTLSLETKTPASVLLVDDARWFPMASRYIEALTAQGVRFDVWETADEQAGPVGARSPTTATLNQYPVVVWFTGYDWFRPILPQEEASLVAYLDQGGRLLLSSQDFLYQHADGPLRQRLGLLDWVESWQPTDAFGVPGHPGGGRWGPLPLAYPFQNWSDAVEPTPDAAPVARGGDGAPLAVAAQGPDDAARTSRTLFYGFPLEALPLSARRTALGNAVDWLSPLGRSRWHVTPTAPAVGALLTHTLIVRNDAAGPLPAAITHTVPASLSLVAGSPSPLLTYDADARELYWAAMLAPDAPVTLTWVATATAPAGAILTSSVRLALPQQRLTSRRDVLLHIAGADLAGSHWISPAWAETPAGRPVTLSFRLRNDGPGALTGGQAHIWVTAGGRPVTASTPLPWGWGRVWWEGDLAPGETRMLTLPLQAGTSPHPLRVDAILEAAAGQRWERRRWLTVQLRDVYLPYVLRH
jgi:subtilisin family serine protease